MISKLFLVALLAVVVVVRSQNEGPFCYACVQMVKSAKEHYHNNFANVTEGELSGWMSNECDSYTEGFADLMCKKLIQESARVLLEALKKGKTAEEVCKASTIC
ncbi:hypothetical protein L596_008575 [Steinernema carpocapsae]|uniref:Saposin B-type domain-containing protein n=1 Tax=Steinernema carpocapsae TaxID=34508 RepID=A0A4U5PCW8_STECR|nr:hypothetical protein L596_008575 [Steinernema carpocapsae]